MKKLADLIADCRVRAARGKRAPLPEEARLPQWPDSIRAVPNAILRSSLFSSTGRGRRRYAEGEPLAALDGIEIYYTGQRLGQDDLDVWENLLHAVRSQSLGEQCRVTSYSLLKLIGLTDTGKNRAALQKRIERLVAAALTIRQGRYIYIGSLIRSSVKDEKTQEWVIELARTCVRYLTNTSSHKWTGGYAARLMGSRSRNGYTVFIQVMQRRFLLKYEHCTNFAEARQSAWIITGRICARRYSL